MSNVKCLTVHQNKCIISAEVLTQKKESTVSTIITSIRYKLRCNKAGAEIVLHNITIGDCPFCHRTIGKKKGQCDVAQTILATTTISRSSEYDPFKKCGKRQLKISRKINIDDFVVREYEQI